MTRRGILSYAAPALVIALLAALVTWPQSLYLTTRLGAHVDPLFSIWRLAWVAHALAANPRHLFDGNIFHPAPNTLTYSDATMLEGVLAAPFFWIGGSPIVIYNVLLLGGIAASGIAMFVLARHLIGRTGPALVSAAIFTMAPFRIEHFMHLELQWAMWVPLTLWAIHRSIEDRSWRHGTLAGVFLWLQILSSVYYGVFLAITVAAFACLMLVAYPRAALRALPALAIGAALASALAFPYAIPYMQTARTIGTREAAEVTIYSATLSSYLASSQQSWLWGWTANRWGSVELSLFPGAVAIVLAAVAILDRPHRLVLVYAALAAVTIELSLGLNGHVYTWLFDHVSALHGLRSPSRFGLIACAAIAILAGFGARALQNRLTASGPRAGAAFSSALLAMIALDDGTTGMSLMTPQYQPPSAFNVYKTIRALGPGPIVELPLAKLDALPGHEPTYAFWSISHWHPIVNGYSGYYPQEFVDTVVRMEGFPDDRSIAQLTYAGVRYVVVHRAFYQPDDYQSLLERIADRAELRPNGTYSDPSGEAELYVLTK